MAKIQRIIGLNGFTVFTAEVVEAARQCFVIVPNEGDIDRCQNGAI